MVLHVLIHSSRVHQDLVSGVLHFFVLLKYLIISGCGRLSPYDLEMLPISPQQAYSFVVDFLNNSV